MTVAELIEELKKFDSDMEVAVSLDDVKYSDWCRNVRFEVHKVFDPQNKKLCGFVKEILIL